ncbi:MAG: hypothetical protein RL427_357 [Bacteroidota bacterium]|jgi:photosystem II stability/assembly factor-like uncharacterized protein
MKKIITLFLLLVSLSFYGQWWVPQNSGVTANLNDVYGITGDVVVVVGDFGIILKTIDGGDHWIVKPSGTTANLLKVQFSNASIGYAVGENGTLLKSMDGGESWTSIATGFTTSLSGLTCLNENSFYISGANGLIKRTNDGGTNFSDYSYPGDYNFSTIQFLNAQVGYASSYNLFQTGSSLFIKTTDGGVTWNVLPTAATTFYFLTENIGFVKNGVVYKTIDGALNLSNAGDSWGNYTDLYSMNENEVWSIEDSFTLCDCDTYCIMRNNVTDPESPVVADNCYLSTAGHTPFKAITFADATNGYVVGDYGVILKNITGTMEHLSNETFSRPDLITLTPNPASTFITIENKSLSPLELVRVLDMNGRTVFIGTKGTSTLDVSALAKGIYVVQINYAAGMTIKKLIKE